LRKNASSNQAVADNNTYFIHFHADDHSERNASLAPAYSPLAGTLSGVKWHVQSSTEPGIHAERADLFDSSASENLGSSYVTGNDAGCKVWAPSALSTSDYVPRYTGSCRDGRAQGKGRLEWLLRYAELKPKAIWDGYFENGVFTGNQPSIGHIDPMPGDQYLVRLGSLNGGGQLTLVDTSPQTEPMVLCPARSLAISLDSATATDDDAVKLAMQSAARRYRLVCSAALGNPLLEAYDVPIEINDKGRIPQSIARARMDWPGSEISAYTNSASDAVRAKQRSSAAEDRLAKSHAQFDSFSRQNGIASWVTAAQLDANPFKYEGKLVGIVVAMSRMLTRDRALVDNGTRDAGGTVQIEGITPDFPDRDHPVLVAARVGKRLAVQEAGGEEYTTIQKVAVLPCSLSDCSDLLGWQRGPNRIKWGDPYSPAS
jgi:hypothetical protein